MTTAQHDLTDTEYVETLGRCYAAHLRRHGLAVHVGWGQRLETTAGGRSSYIVDVIALRLPNFDRAEFTIGDKGFLYEPDGRGERWRWVGHDDPKSLDKMLAWAWEAFRQHEEQGYGPLWQEA